MPTARDIIGRKQRSSGKAQARPAPPKSGKRRKAVERVQTKKSVVSRAQREALAARPGMEKTPRHRIAKRRGYTSSSILPPAFF